MASDAPHLGAVRQITSPKGDQEKANPSADPITIAVRISGSAIPRQLVRTVSSMATVLLTMSGSPGQRSRWTLDSCPGCSNVQRFARAASNRLKVHRTRLAIRGLADVVTETLTDFWSNILVPKDGACFEAQVIAARFRLDFPIALDGIERFDGAKIFHGEFLRVTTAKMAAAASRRERWAEERLSAKDRQFRLVAILTNTAAIARMQVTNVFRTLLSPVLILF